MLAVLSVVLWGLCVGGLLGGCHPKAKATRPLRKPTVQVVIRTRTRDPRRQPTIEGAAVGVLTSRSYPVVREQEFKRVHKLARKVLGGGSVPAQSISLADIRLEVVAWVEGGRGRAMASAYEPLQRQLIAQKNASGRSMGRGGESASLQDAVRQATVGVLGLVWQYWQKQGGASRYVVMVAGSLSRSPDLGDRLSLAIKRMRGVRDFRRVTLTEQRLHLTFLCTLGPLETKIALRRLLRQTKGASPFRLRTPHPRWLMATLTSASTK